MTTQTADLVDIETISDHGGEPLSSGVHATAPNDADSTPRGDTSRTAPRTPSSKTHQLFLSQLNPTYEELVQRTNRLHDEIQQLQQLISQLHQERDDLKSHIQSKDDALIQATVDLETESDLLLKARKELREKRNHVEIVARENEILDNVTSLNVLTSQHREQFKKDRERSNVLELDDDGLAKIKDLQNELRLKHQQMNKLNDEIDLLVSLNEKKERALEDIENQIKMFQWKEDKAYELECTNNELSYQAENLEKEIKTLQQITRMKSQTIEKLHNQLDQWKHLEEDHIDLKKKLNVKEQEFEDIENKIRQEEEENREKDEEIERIMSSRDHVPIRTLQSDNIFLKDQVKQNQTKQSTLEKTIKWQEKQISMLTQRLNQLNFALKETKINRLLKHRGGSSTARSTGAQSARILKELGERPSSDQVPLYLYLLMEHNASLLKEKAKKAELLLQDKDSVAEALESRIDELEQSKRDEGFQYKKISNELKQELDNLREQIMEIETSFKEKETSIKKESLLLKKRLWSLYQQNRASPSQ